MAPPNHADHGAQGDAPKVVIAASTIAECLHFVTLARNLAESFRTPVIILTDANLATGVQPVPRPEVTEDWFPPPLDQSAWSDDVAPYDWDEKTGLSERPIPGMQGGEYILTGLAHNRLSKIAYGGLLAQAYLAHRPQAIERLILSSTGPAGNAFIRPGSMSKASRPALSASWVATAGVPCRAPMCVSPAPELAPSEKSG